MKYDFNETAISHKTDRYESSKSELIVRRGNTFNVTFTFSNLTDEDNSLMELQLSYKWGYESGVVPIKKNSINGAYTPTYWSYKIIEQSKDENTTKFTLEFSVPLNSAIGAYSLEVVHNSSVIYSSQKSEEVRVIVLFNPFHKSEQVYLNNQNHLDEYLISDVGAVYLGSSFWSNGQQWIFGQYASGVLNGLMKLLDNHSGGRMLNSINYTVRSDPIILSRKIAGIVHNVDSFSGLMQGNWGNNWRGGISPLEWTSSVPIYEEYYETSSTVKYAQCWVFAAVATTALRTLGVPSRPITTFDAAHNTMDDLIINRCNVTNPSWDIRPYCDGDSIWNFHSWTEAWMTRPDLCEGTDFCPNYSGWQIVDGTPQEPSIHDEKYVVGPSPKSATLHGHVNANYDSSFVFAEVSAPVVTWGIYNGSLAKPLSVDYTRVGSRIVTKKAGSDETEDITHTYRHPDPDWHRVTLINAFNTKGINVEILGHNLTTEPVVEIIIDKPQQIIVGENITMNVTLRNNDKNLNQTVRYTIRVDSIYYTGVFSQNVLEQEFTEKLMPNETKSSVITIPFDDYYFKLVDLMHLNLVVKLHAAESDYSYFNEDDFSLITPPVTIKNETKFGLNQPVSLVVTMTNSLPLRLTDCVLTITGLRHITSVNIPSINSNETMINTAVIINDDTHPAIFAKVDCEQLTGMKGFLRAS